MTLFSAAAGATIGFVGKWISASVRKEFIMRRPWEAVLWVGLFGYTGHRHPQHMATLEAYRDEMIAVRNAYVKAGNFPKLEDQ
ncbi:hypothetical protein FVE85_6741 [Porphyridium purpureum]|uniref:Uncharacterized protein n=1 Tax=Porphyridium purpureum TaxID=35688 RepID=A0A5J4Z650_PORPP|nr:hypothetical protein FVE85_6741 [Porphyridium purpureum]|eukprot:POR5198..scf295_1